MPIKDLYFPNRTVWHCFHVMCLCICLCATETIYPTNSTVWIYENVLGAYKSQQQQQQQQLHNSNSSSSSHNGNADTLAFSWTNFNSVYCVFLLLFFSLTLYYARFACECIKDVRIRLLKRCVSQRAVCCSHGEHEKFISWKLRSLYVVISIRMPVCLVYCEWNNGWTNMATTNISFSPDQKGGKRTFKPIPFAGH